MIMNYLPPKLPTFLTIQSTLVKQKKKKKLASERIYVLFFTQSNTIVVYWISSPKSQNTPKTENLWCPDTSNREYIVPYHIRYFTFVCKICLSAILMVYPCVSMCIIPKNKGHAMATNSVYLHASQSNPRGLHIQNPSLELN